MSSSSSVCANIALLPPVLQPLLDRVPPLLLTASGSLVLLWIVWKVLLIGVSVLSSIHETLFVRFPKIVLDDLPDAVTKDDGVKSPPAKEHPPLQSNSSKGFIQCYDPSTFQWLGQVPAMTPNDVNEVCRKAAIAQQTWKTTTFAQRRQVLRTLQAYICDHVHEICRCSTRDSGKPIVDAALGEVLTTCEKIRTIVANGQDWLQPDRRPVGPMFMHKRAQVEYVPLGVIGTIAPWNYP